jgi:hypothetical protein
LSRAYNAPDLVPAISTRLYCAGTEVVAMFAHTLATTAISRFGFALGIASMVAVLAVAAPLGDTPPTTTRKDSASASGTSAFGGHAPVSTGSDRNTAVRDILEIRREQGGLLDGTLLHELAAPPHDKSGDFPATSHWEDDEFARALRDVVATAPTTVEPPDPIAPRGKTLAGGAAYGERVDPDLDFTMPLRDSALVQSLRSASRQLDLQANDLEDKDQFDDADQLRALSDRLRHVARRWVATGAPGERLGSQPVDPAGTR